MADGRQPGRVRYPGDVLEAVDGLDEKDFPFCHEEADLYERIIAREFVNVTDRDASVRYYGWVEEIPGKSMVRAMALYGPARPRVMAQARVRFHRKYSHGAARVTALGIFIPIWAFLTAVTCLVNRCPVGDATSVEPSRLGWGLRGLLAARLNGTTRRVKPRQAASGITAVGFA